MAVVLLGLCLFASVTWLMWLVISSLVVGFRHPPVELPDVPLTRGRKMVAVLCALILVGCFLPVPMSVVQGAVL